MTGFERLLELLEARPGQVRRHGRNYRAHCPAHEDDNPSLDVADAGDGTPLVICRSHGCSYDEVLAALGVTRAELNGDRRRGDPVAVYRYVDEQGAPLFEVGRFPKPGDRKTFAQRRPGAPDWKGGIGNTRRVLYRLPEVVEGVAAGRAIWIVEGEKHADLLRRRGRVSTTNPMGADKWRSEYADLLAGAARVIVLADDDTRGRAHADEVARSLVGRVDELKVVELYPRGESKRDVVDFYADADTPEDADRELVAIVEGAAVYNDGAAGSSSSAGSAGSRRLVATPLIEVDMRSIEFFDRPLWQQSAFTLLAGMKGAGKGTYLAGLAARVSRDGRNVLFVSSEDSVTIDLKPRLVAAGALIDRCYVIRQHVDLPDDVPELKTLALELGDVGLFVVDPVANHIGDRDSNSDAAVRDAIAPLNELADELRCMLIGVRHPGKDRSRGALASILGSTAWVDTPRAVVMIAVDDEDDEVRHIQVVAGNRSRNGSAQMFRIDAVDVAGLAEPITVAVPLGESSKSVDDLIAGDRAKDSTAPSKSAEARELMLDILERDGEHESDALDARVASEVGLKARTVMNIRRQLTKDGLVKAIPERDEAFGDVKRWKVARTAAPR